MTQLKDAIGFEITKLVTSPVAQPAGIETAVAVRRLPGGPLGGLLIALNGGLASAWISTIKALAEPENPARPESAMAPVSTLETTLMENPQTFFASLNLVTLREFNSLVNPLWQELIQSKQGRGRRGVRRKVVRAAERSDCSGRKRRGQVLLRR